MKKTVLLASVLLSSLLFGASYEEGMSAAKAKDYKKAASIFEELCTKNKDAVSCYNAGFLYKSGDGVGKNLQKASDLFQKACDSGHGEGCSALGYLYENGVGVPKNEKKALELYEKGCGLNDNYSCFNAGEYYTLGKGVAKDLVKAHYAYEKACGLNNASACYYYGLNLFNGVQGIDVRKTNVGFYYLDRACVLGSKNACTASRQAMKMEIETFK